MGVGFKPQPCDNCGYLPENNLSEGRGFVAATNLIVWCKSCNELVTIKPSIAEGHETAGDYLTAIKKRWLSRPRDGNPEYVPPKFDTCPNCETHNEYTDATVIDESFDGKTLLCLRCNVGHLYLKHYIDWD